MANFTPFANWDEPAYDPKLHNPRTGVIIKEYQAYNDGSTQEYSVYIPRAYTPEHPWPLVVAMHGLGGHHTNVINNATYQTLAEQRGFIMLSPSGRGRRNFFRGPGEEAVLRAIEEVRKAYNVDPDRISLTGVSMGGSGSMHLALHYPDRWAASHPVCGLYTFGQMGVLADADPDPYELSNNSDISFIAENAYGFPLRFVHGDADATVPVEHGRRMDQRFRELGYPTTYVEVPGFPHGDPDVVGRHDWLEGHRLRRHPSRIVYKTYSPYYDRAYWVRVEDFVHFNQAGLIQAEAFLDNKIQIQTENLAQFSLYFDDHLLDLSAPVEVQVDGQAVFSEPPPTSREVTLSRSDSGRWALGPLPPTQALRKQWGLSGPMNDIFREPFIVVYGASGDADATEINRREGGKLLYWFRERYNATYQLKADTEVTEEDIANYHLVLYGTPANHALLVRMLDQLPIHVTPNSLTLGGDTFHGEDLLFIYPNPLNPEKYVEIGTGWRDEAVANIDQVPGRGVNDYVVFNSASKTSGGGFVQVGVPLAKGFFDKLWQPETDEVRRARWEADRSLAARLSAQPPERIHLSPGDPVPDFAVTTFDGTEFRYADLRGKKACLVLLSGAPFGPKVAAALKETYAQHRDALEIVLAVGVPNNWDKGAVALFLQAREIDFPVTNDEPKELARLLGKEGVPEAYFIQHDGTIYQVARADDPMWTDPQRLHGTLNALVAESSLA
ncbi:MAG: redoxin domain-containing protein [Chloroflexi bacterium]|nr:redoxin domain-containing protein [Chloroflexota bacterium]